MRHRRIELRIDEVVVHGADADPRALREAFGGELERLAADGGVPRATPSAETIDAGTVRPRAGELGVAVARAVWRGLEG